MTRLYHIEGISCSFVFIFFSWHSGLEALFVWWAFWGWGITCWKATVPHGSQLGLELRQAWGLAQTLQCASLIAGPPLRVKPSNYTVSVWQMSFVPLLWQDPFLLPLCDEAVYVCSLEGCSNLVFEGFSLSPSISLSSSIFLTLPSYLFLIFLIVKIC